MSGQSQATLPLVFGAEGCLQFTLMSLSGVLDNFDRQFLEKAMRTYARLYVSEALSGDVLIGSAEQ